MTTEGKSEGMSLLDIYENYFGNEIDKESDTWKTFANIILDRQAFYKVVLEEVVPRLTGNMDNDTTDDTAYETKEIEEAVAHLAWIMWDGSRPDGTSFGDTSWKTLVNMMIQLKGLEIKHYG